MAEAVGLKSRDQKKLDRAAELTATLGEHEEVSAERARLWRELREAGVPTSQIAEACGVTPVAVRKACGKDR